MLAVLAGDVDEYVRSAVTENDATSPQMLEVPPGVVRPGEYRRPQNPRVPQSWLNDSRSLEGYRRFGPHEMVSLLARVDEIMQAAGCSPVHQVAVQGA